MTRAARTLFLLFALLAVAACGGSDDGGSGPSGPIDGSGHATKGPIGSSTIDLHRFTTSLGMGERVAGPFTTDANGDWNGEIPAGTNEALLVVVSGGSYTDEATSESVSLSSSMYGIWRPSTGVGNANPFTHAAVLNAQQRVADGSSPSDAITDALDELQEQFGYDVTSVLPPVAKRGNDASLIQWAFLNGFSELIQDLGLTSVDLWEAAVALMEDLSDGILQGVDIFGNTIELDNGEGSTVSLPVLDLTGVQELVDAAIDWANTNAPNIIIPDLDFGDFGDTETGGGGGVGDDIEGSFDASGDGAEVFGSTFEPSAAGYNQNGPVGAIAMIDDESLVSIGFLSQTLDVVSLTATNVEFGWSFINIGQQTIPGATVTQDGDTWTIDLDNVTLPQVSGKKGAGDLTLDGTIDVTITEIPE